MLRLKNTSLSLLLLLLAGCGAHKAQEEPEVLTSVQIHDRNGFNETISVKSRLATFDKVDFMAPQPYQKVMRVYGRSKTGQAAKVTSYHPNGQLWQYLEILNGRAYGSYKEWHANGQMKLDAYVIEGLADIAEKAQISWVFDGKSCAYDQEGRLIAEIYYNKGALEGNSLYFHPNGQLSKKIPYHHNLVEGDFLVYNEAGELIERIPHVNDIRHGKAEGWWAPNLVKYVENYSEGLLKNAVYVKPDGTQIAYIQNGNGTRATFKDWKLYSLSEFQDGVLKGKIEIFDKDGWLVNSYHVNDGKKQGEEWEYYPKDKQAKLYLYWNDDKIQGMAKTWYLNGVQQSEREMQSNKKHGLSFAWYEEGQLMLMEEYDNDVLVKGSYFKRGDKLPVSKIDDGKGIATIYDHKGHFIKKIPYEKGRPVLE